MPVRSRSKSRLVCNRPQKSWKPSKKRVVKACSGGKEKIIHFGASGYGHNYSDKARKSFRARHNCASAKDKLTARYWACKNLWTKGGSRKSCPRSRRCKGASPRRKSPVKRSRVRSKNKSRNKRKSPVRRSRNKSRSRRKPQKRRSRSRSRSRR